jgi:hypothetical protein
MFFMIAALSGSRSNAPLRSLATINSDFLGAGAPGKMTALEMYRVCPSGLMPTSMFTAPGTLGLMSPDNGRTSLTPFSSKSPV